MTKLYKIFNSQTSSISHQVARSLFIIWAATAIVIIFYINIELRDRVIAEQAALHHAEVLVRLVTDHASSTFRTVDLGLHHLQSQLPPIKSGKGHEDQAFNAKATALMNEHLQMMPGVVAITWADSDGVVIANNTSSNPSPAITSHRYFQENVNNNDRSVFSGLIENDESGKTDVVIAHSLIDSQGNNQGSIYATISSSEHFMAYYQSLNLPPGTSVSLWNRSERKMIVRYPSKADYVGQTSPFRVFDHLHNSPNIIQDSAVVPSPLDGMMKAIAVRKSIDYPFHGVVALSSSQYLSEWESEIKQTTAACILIIIFATIFSFMTFRKAKLNRNLAHEKSRLRAIIDTIPDLVFIKDANYRYTGCNRPFEEFIGHTELELLGRDDFYFFQPDVAQFFRRHDVAMLSSGSPHRNEEWVTYPDGRNFCLDTVKVPFYDLEGKLLGLVGISRDITQLHQLTKSLHESEELFRTIVSQAADGIDLVDIKTLRIIEVNDAACRMMGYAREEYLQLTLSDIQPDLDELAIRAVIEKIISEGTLSFEARHRRKSGDIFDINLSVRHIGLKGQDCLVAVWRDISDEKRLKRELDEALLFLSESQSIAHVGGWKVNPESGYVMWTDEVYRLVERPIKEQIDIQSGLNYYAPDERPKIIAALETAWQTGDGFLIECMMISSSGRHFWSEVHCIGRVNHASASYIVGTIQDITQRKLDKERIEDLLAQQTAILDNEMVGIVIAKDRTIKWSNHAFERILGYSRGELSGIPTRQNYCNEESYRVLGSEAYPIIRAGGVYRAQIEHLRKDQSRIWADVCGSLLSPDTGETLWMFLDISERRAAEQALVEEQKVRDTIINAMPGIFYALDETGTFTFWNHTFEEVTGYSAMELKKLNAIDLFRGQDRENISDSIRRVFENGIADAEADLVSRSGRHQPYYFTGRHIVISGQSVLVGAGVDISARKLVEQRLSNLNIELEQRVVERTRALEKINSELQDTQFAMDSVGIGISWVDISSGRFIYVNHYYADFLGYTESEVLNLHVSDIDPNFPPERYQEIIRKVERLGYLEFETEHLTRIGKRVPVEIKIYFRGATREREAQLIAFMTDISKRQEATQQLVAVKSVLEQVMANTPVVIYDYVRHPDGRGQFLYVSPRCREMLEIEAEDLIADVNLFWSLVLPEDLPSFRDDDESTAASSDKFDHTCRLRTARTGKQIWVRLVSRKCDPDQRSAGLPIWSGAMTDVTDMKQIELDREEARKAAEAANQAKSAFLANMSHEIRTPLNAILGLGHLMRGEDMSETQLKRLEKMHVAGQHLLSIINDVLDLSKIEAGGLELETCNFHLSTVLDNVASIVRDSASGKGLFLGTDPDHVPMWLRGDVTRLRQALLNFAGNAVKFTQIGGVTLRAVLLEENEAELVVRFEVQDTGIGISSNQRARLFQAFEQGDSSTARKYGGTGLGLALTKRLVELMNGTIGVDSAVEVGSTFWFTVPLQRGHGPMPQHPATRQLLSAEAQLRHHHRGARILLVEDNPIGVEVVQQMLNGVGLDVAIAGNGREALELAGSENFDLVLMDLQMPEMGGLEAARSLRVWERYATTPILALTANAFVEDRRACLDAGMNDTLTKPVEPTSLYEALAHWLPVKYETRTRVRVADSNISDVLVQETGDIFESLSKVFGIDISYGLNMMRGNKDKYAALLRRFLISNGNITKELEDALTSENTGGAMRLMHSLKGAASVLGLTEIASLSRNLEAVLKDQSAPTNCRELINRECASLKVAIAALSAAMPPEETQPPPPHLDLTVAQPVLRKLGSLLIQNDMAALTLVDENSAMIKNALGASYENFERHINSFGFDEALKHLRGLIG